MLLCRLMANNTFRENALRVVAVLGLIAILLLGAWGIIQLAFYLPTLFSGLGRTKETVTVTVPAQTISDKAFTLTWKHTGGAGDHSYAVSYSCAQGLSFAVPVPTGALQLVPCDTPFNYINASSSMPIVPVLASGTKQATTTITVAANKLSDGSVTVRGNGRTTVAASTTPSTSAGEAPATTKPVTTTKPKPSTTYVPSGRTQNLYGLPDLEVTMVQAPQVANVGSRITLQFVITNVGSNVAPSGWMFNAILPYQPIYVHPSGGQQALYPGDKIVYTLSYDVVPQGGYGYDYYGGFGGQAQATIEIDPSLYLQESNKLNNTAIATYQVY